MKHTKVVPIIHKYQSSLYHVRNIEGKPFEEWSHRQSLAKILQMSSSALAGLTLTCHSPPPEVNFVAWFKVCFFFCCCCFFYQVTFLGGGKAVFVGGLLPLLHKFFCFDVDFYLISFVMFSKVFYFQTRIK